LQKSRPKRSVFYSLAPGLGKRRAMPFLRNGGRQLRGDSSARRMSLLEQLNFNSDVERWTPTSPRVRMRIAARSLFGC